MAKLNIQIGLRRSGFVEYESSIYPEYSMGMIFIVLEDGRHIAISLQEVCGVVVTPKEEEGQQ